MVGNGSVCPSKHQHDLYEGRVERGMPACKGRILHCSPPAYRHALVQGLVHAKGRDLAGFFIFRAGVAAVRVAKMRIT